MNITLKMDNSFFTALFLTRFSISCLQLDSDPTSNIDNPITDVLLLAQGHEVVDDYQNHVHVRG